MPKIIPKTYTKIPKKSVFIIVSKKKQKVSSSQQSCGLKKTGEVSEWSMVLDSKSSVLSKGPWVRIPPSPPENPVNTVVRRLASHCILFAFIPKTGKLHPLLHP